MLLFILERLDKLACLVSWQMVDAQANFRCCRHRALCQGLRVSEMFGSLEKKNETCQIKQIIHKAGCMEGHLSWSDLYHFCGTIVEVFSFCFIH